MSVAIKFPLAASRYQPSESPDDRSVEARPDLAIRRAAFLRCVVWIVELSGSGISTGASMTGGGTGLGAFGAIRLVTGPMLHPV
ncbi:MAG: hypothetical protein ABTQ25_10565 [Nitrosomonas ureae]